MSLVGTRPPTVDEWDKYELHHRARLATKPGLTGMWQVSGRSNITDFEEVVKLDKQYMLNDATCFKKIFIVTGYTDLRSGIDRLAYTVRSYLGEDAIEPDTLYLFCGRRTDRIKGLVWENDGYLLLYKRLEAGKFQWPRTESEVRSITSQGYLFS